MSTPVIVLSVVVGILLLLFLLSLFGVIPSMGSKMTGYKGAGVTYKSKIKPKVPKKISKFSYAVPTKNQRTKEIKDILHSEIMGLSKFTGISSIQGSVPGTELTDWSSGTAEDAVKSMALGGDIEVRDDVIDNVGEFDEISGGMHLSDNYAEELHREVLGDEFEPLQQEQLEFLKTPAGRSITSRVRDEEFADIIINPSIKKQGFNLYDMEKAAAGGDPMAEQVGTVNSVSGTSPASAGPGLEMQMDQQYV